MTAAIRARKNSPGGGGLRARDPLLHRPGMVDRPGINDGPGDRPGTKDSPADIARGRAAEAPVVDRANADLFPDEELAGYRTQWEAIQTGFVDQPRDAVAQADALVSQLVTRLTDVFTRERSTLEGQWARGTTCRLKTSGSRSPGTAHSSTGCCPCSRSAHVIGVSRLVSIPYPTDAVGACHGILPSSASRDQPGI